MPEFHLPLFEPAVHGLLLLAALALVAMLLTRFKLHFAPRNPSVAGIALLTRNALITIAVILVTLVYFVDLPPQSPLLKTVESVFWVTAIWVSLSLIITGFFGRASDSTWKSGVPSLFIDIIRLSLALIGSALVIAGVWHTDLGAFFATLGIGSIVLGLALQDTLGNLMAGIALMFERPFYEGDWIQVGDTIGRVTEMNWRAVRLRTRPLDMVVVPNSVLGKEKIHNFSRPTAVHRCDAVIGFSYNDPPNTVKSVLLRAARQTRGVLADPAPQIFTIGYADSAVTYQTRLYIDDFGRSEPIMDSFMTQVWYAARRGKINIPFPIRTVYKTEMPPAHRADVAEEIRRAVRLVPIFDALVDAEIAILADDSVSETFAAGERILDQGDEGDSLYIIRSGEVVVSAIDPRGAEREVARLSAGKFFGEMALLTGQSRSASVTASEDSEIVVVRHESLARVLETRPALADELASIVSTRQSGIEEALKDGPSADRPRADADQQRQLLTRIKKFFGI